MEGNAVDGVNVSSFPVALEGEVLGLCNIVINVLHSHPALNGAHQVPGLVCNMRQIHTWQQQ